MTHANPSCASRSVTFPDVDPTEWQETEREAHDGFAWVTYVRR